MSEKMFVIFVLCTCILAVIVYQFMHDEGRMIRPGGAVLTHGVRYSVGGTVYTFDAESLPPRKSVLWPYMMQPESVLLRSRELTSRVFGALGDRAWLSGSSLLAFIRGGTVSPSEHVVHLNMLFSDRRVLFSSEMHTRCRAQFGLEINLRRGIESGRFITITMLEDTLNEAVVRVSFVADAGDDVLAVVKSWDDDAVELCSRRRWPRDWVHPISTCIIDNITVSTPSKPEFICVMLSRTS